MARGMSSRRNPAKGQRPTRSRPPTKVERERDGLRRALIGRAFEQQVQNHFSDKEWKLTSRKMIRGLEIDLYGERSEGFPSEKEFLLVECKKKDRVTSADVMRFIRKVADFYRHLESDWLGNKPPLTAIVAHTGEVSADAKAAAENIRPKIQFRKF